MASPGALAPLLECRVHLSFLTEEQLFALEQLSPISSQALRLELRQAKDDLEATVTDGKVLSATHA